MYSHFYPTASLFFIKTVDGMPTTFANLFLCHSRRFATNSGLILLFPFQNIKAGNDNGLNCAMFRHESPRMGFGC